MKYRELLDELKAMSDEELDLDVMVFFEDYGDILPAHSLSLNGDGESLCSDDLDEEYPLIFCE